ncbi:U2 snRNP complex subunit YSF3 [Ascoidea rubescens DSM 1968]|uniref:Splicing factor 3B subunit 5/RDS3 complex subunit 10 n=1 Tax=Ascoidea rubescens DSM 1968 TaxID=1344418 RepID=A0A1D2VEA8_9ASCO|nr:splicing factor 3B subunit 5/RDS3 complex subunit 10 [Ascoidea rubescens DSM 1968]ODV59833.1 splicing factor 3B subunit 5/RDS3 complex subunit 10 [Ascoidea rubescens DSM 1968]
MSDKLRDQQLFDHLKSRYIGVGDADTTQDEWISNIKRDTYSSFASHPNLLYYYSISTNQPKALTQFHFINKMIDPINKKSENENS